VLSSLSGLALLLAARRALWVLSYTVARRQRELGVRGVLGATRRGIVVMVVREGMTVVIVGVTLGLVGAAA
jgi:putative ABC transport system permease protein